MNVEDKYLTLTACGLSDNESYLFSFLCRDLYDPRLLILVGRFTEFQDVLISGRYPSGMIPRLGLSPFSELTRRSTDCALPTAAIPFTEETIKISTSEIPYYLQMD